MAGNVTDEFSKTRLRILCTSRNFTVDYEVCKYMLKGLLTVVRIFDASGIKK